MRDHIPNIGQPFIVQNRLLNLNRLKMKACSPSDHPNDSTFY